MVLAATSLHSFFSHSFVHSFNYFLGLLFFPNLVLGSEDTVVHKTKSLPTHRFHSVWGRPSGNPNHIDIWSGGENVLRQVIDGES